MRLFKNFLKFILNFANNPNKFVDDIENTYIRCRTETTGMDPHYYLAQTWLTYMASCGKNVEKEEFQIAAFPVTQLIACVPHPYCGRALGIFLLYKKNPKILKQYPLLLDDFNRFIYPVFEVAEKGNIEELYKKYNPNINKEPARQ